MGQHTGRLRARGMTRATLRRLLLLAIGVLYVVSIPWYRSAGESAPSRAGVPEWVLVAVVCYVAAAVLNAAAWLLTDIPEDCGREER